MVSQGAERNWKGPDATALKMAERLLKSSAPPPPEHAAMLKEIIAILSFTKVASPQGEGTKLSI